MTIYRILESQTFNYFFRIFLICWILFAIYMYHANTFFFELTIIISVILIFISFNRQELILTERELILKTTRLIRSDKIKRRIFLKEINDCSLEFISPTTSTFILNLFEYIPGTLNTNRNLVVRLKNNEQIRIRTLGTTAQLVELVDRLKKQL